MAAELFSALVSLATLVKQIADDASANASIAVDLRERVELVIRVLQKYPDPSELDEILLSKLFKLLMEAHDSLISYNSLPSMTRMLKAISIRQEFEGLDSAIGKCLDDIVLCISVVSASKLAAKETVENSQCDCVNSYLSRHRRKNCKLRSVKDALMRGVVAGAEQGAAIGTSVTTAAVISAPGIVAGAATSAVSENVFSAIRKK